MALSEFPNDPRVYMFLGDWINISLGKSNGEGYVRQTALIDISTGTEDLSTEVNPGTCSLILDNTDGRFSPRNPMGPYYEVLNVYTLMTVLLDEIVDTFTRTADTDSWNDTDTGETYATQSLNGVISATDYSTDGTHGIHSVPAAAAYRMSYFNSSSGAPLAYNIFQKIRVTIPFTDVTGGGLEPANLVCRVQSATTYYLLRVVIETDESITLRIMIDGNTTIAGPVTVAGITHSSSQPLWIGFGAFEDSLYGMVWTGDERADEPVEWDISVTDDTYGYGRYGVRSGVAAGNTNAKPIVYTYDNYQVYVAQFTGEIPSFPPEFTDDNGDAIVPIEAAGILSRQSESNIPLLSSPRRWYETHAFNLPDFYWPMDEGELAQACRNTVGSPELLLELDPSFSIFDTSGEKHLGQAKLGAWLPNGVHLRDGDAFVVYLPTGTAEVTEDRWVIDFCRVGGINTGGEFDLAGYLPDGVTILGLPVDRFGLTFDSAAQELVVGPGMDEPQITLDTTTFPTNIYDGAIHYFRFRVNVTLVDDIFWELTVDGTIVDSATIADHPMLARIAALDFGARLIPDVDPVGFSGLALFLTNDPFSDIDLTYSHILGNAGEVANDRLVRLATEQGIGVFSSGGSGAEMGPQFPDTILNQFGEIVRTDGGILRELLGSRAITFDTLSDLRTRTSVLSLDVGAGHLYPPFQPIDDNETLLNKVRATKRAGGDYTYERTDGPRGTTDPRDGGAGVKDDEVNCNPQSESQLISIAQREVAEGTVDRPRFPSISVNLMADVFRNNMTLRRQVLDTYVSQRMQLTNMEANYIFDDSDLLVIGMKKQLGHFEHIITFNTRPFDTFDVFRVETEGSILGTNSSFVVDALDDDDTALRVATNGDALWTTNAGSLPILAKMRGEDISITNVTTTAPSFRSVGAASHGDNATLNPALPTGQLVGDMLVCVTVIRNTAGTANTPSGYASFTSGSFTHLNVAVKQSVGAGESSPSCTYSGGVAGDTTSAVVFALPNAPLVYGGAIQSNSSAQNIAYPQLELLRCNGIMILIAWKQDDFTSIAVPLGFTEMIEASTTTGNDQSLYIAYKLTPRVDTEGAGELVVTGGASAISKAVLMHLQNPQDLTVTRSMNGVVKSHPAETDIRVAYPKRLG